MEELKEKKKRRSKLLYVMPNSVVLAKIRSMLVNAIYSPLHGIDASLLSKLFSQDCSPSTIYRDLREAKKQKDQSVKEVEKTNE